MGRLDGLDSLIFIPLNDLGSYGFTSSWILCRKGFIHMPTITISFVKKYFEDLNLSI
jgi:hypothetical protein